MNPGDIVHIIQQRGTGSHARHIDRGVGIIIAVHPEPARCWGSHKLSIGSWVTVKLAERVERFHESSVHPITRTPSRRK